MLVRLLCSVISVVIVVLNLLCICGIVSVCYWVLCGGRLFIVMCRLCSFCFSVVVGVCSVVCVLVMLWFFVR